MKLNIGKELAALRRLTLKELRQRYADLHGEETRTFNRQWLVKRIIWRMQALAEGDLSERARRRAVELANDADLRLHPPKLSTADSNGGDVAVRTIRIRSDNRIPPPGALITRKYKNETVNVKVMPGGFEYEGEIYKSLSAVAKHITGSHCNGYLFFRLGGHGGAE